MTITEALAEIKTLDKRIAKKTAYLMEYLWRRADIKDPLAKEEGGSKGEVDRTFQSIYDLFKRRLNLRMGIAQANDVATITIHGETRTISEWLVWRREVAPLEKSLLHQMVTTASGLRQKINSRPGTRIADDPNSDDPNEVVVNFDEKEVRGRQEQVEAILGDLDGQLSLKNATVTLASEYLL